MLETTRRMTHVLGGTALEQLGSDARFVVDAPDGSQLKVTIEGRQQRVLAVLRDGKGVVRADIDVGPVLKATEDNLHPGRVTLHVLSLRIHLDSQPELGVVVCNSP